MLQGGAAHIARYASKIYTRGMRFWVDVPQGQSVRVELFIKYLAVRACMLPC